MAWEVPGVNWALGLRDPNAISGIGDSLMGALDRRSAKKLDRATAAAFQGGIPTTADGSPDYAAMATKLFEVGNTEQGLGLTRLAETQAQNAWQRGLQQQELASELMRDERDFGFQQSQYERDFGLKQADAERDYEIDRARLELDQKKASQPSASASTLPAEMGARIGLGDQFLSELPDLKETAETLFGGEGFDVTNRAALAAGMGKPAELWRRIETGKEALVRNLTGAGMAQAEAENQAARYQIGAADTIETIRSKLSGLEKDLQATRQGAIAARTGQMSNGSGDLVAGPALTTPEQSVPQQVDSTVAIERARRAIDAGAPREAVIERLKLAGIDPAGI